MLVKEALLLVPHESLYLRPMVYENSEYKYHCIVKGEFKWFDKDIPRKYKIHALPTILQWIKQYNNYVELIL